MDNAEIAARLAIQNLEGEYARSWDTGDARGWANVFADDGVFEIVVVGEKPGIFVQGSNELENFCQEFTEKVQGLHLMHLPAMTINGDSAESWMHFEFRSGAGLEQNSVMGVYLTSFILTDQGWRMSHRREQAVARSVGGFYSIPSREQLLDNCRAN